MSWQTEIKLFQTKNWLCFYLFSQGKTDQEVCEGTEDLAHRSDESKDSLFHAACRGDASRCQGVAGTSRWNAGESDRGAWWG
jgi:hypothetical protein